MALPGTAERDGLHIGAVLPGRSDIHNCILVMWLALPHHPGVAHCGVIRGYLSDLIPPSVIGVSVCQPTLRLRGYYLKEEAWNNKGF